MGRNGRSLITYSYNYHRILSKVVYNMYVLYVSRGMVFWWGCSYGLASDAMMVGGSEGQGMDYDIDVGFERWQDLTQQILPILFVNDIWSTHTCCVCQVIKQSANTYKTNEMSIEEKVGETLQPLCNSQFYNNKGTLVEYNISQQAQALPHIMLTLLLCMATSYEIPKKYSLDSMPHPSA